MKYITFAFLVTALLTAGCNRGDGRDAASNRTSTSTIGIIAPVEFSEAFSSLKSAINERPITTKIGEIISFSPVFSNGPKGLRDTVAVSGQNTSLIILPHPSLRPLIESELQGIGGTGLSDCTAIASSALTVVHRASDSFSFSQSENPVGIGEILAPPPDVAADGTKTPLFAATNPLTSTSGALAFLHAFTSVTKRDISTITPETLGSSSEAISRVNQSIVQYFHSDQRMLEWMARQEGGSALLGVTTSQQFAAYMARKPDSGLISHQLEDRGVSAQIYLACKIVGPWVNSKTVSHVDTALSFLTSEVAQSSFSRFGFNPSHTIQSDDRTDDGSLATLLSTISNFWLDFEKPAAPTLVIDNSISMEGALLESVKSELSKFISSTSASYSRSARPPPLSLITFATKAEVVTKFSTDRIELIQGINSMRALGGSAVRDAIMLAVNLFDDNAVPGMRRPVLVLVDGTDTASVTTAQQIVLTLPALLNRRKVVLYVIGIGSTSAQYGDIPEIVSSIGGLFRTADPIKLTEELSTIWEDFR